MIYLFSGLFISGIFGRLTLLAVRSDIFIEDQSSKSILRVILEIVQTLTGICAFVFSFFIFAWWLPLLLGALCYGVIPLLVVNKKSFWSLYSLQPYMSVVSIFCSIMVLNLYFNFL